MSKATFLIWFFIGQSCTDDSECGLSNSVCSVSKKCECNFNAGYEEVNDSIGTGYCTKSLGRLYKHTVSKNECRASCK